MKSNWSSVLGLAALLTLAGCEREVLKEPDPITVVVTVEYQNGKVIQFIYHGELIWQSELAKEMSHHQQGDLTFIDYTNLSDQKKSLLFQGGEMVKVTTP